MPVALLESLRKEKGQWRVDTVVEVEGARIQYSLHIETHASVKRGGRPNAFGAFEAFGVRSPNASNTPILQMMGPRSRPRFSGLSPGKRGFVLDS
jgi:hypothetical protein